MRRRHLRNCFAAICFCANIGAGIVASPQAPTASTASVGLTKKTTPTSGAGASHQRIVSMAPSITELVYALGAGNDLVGVTKYCKYPPPADTLPEVGGFLDPNYEAILAVRPTLLLTLVEQSEVAQRATTLGINAVSVNHQTIAGIFESYKIAGQAMGVAERGDSLARAHSAIVADMRARYAPGPKVARPRTLVVIGHNTDSGAITAVTCAAKERYYSAMLDIAGAVNALVDSVVRYPQLSAEGLLALDPEVIIDLFYAEGPSALDTAFVRAQWRSLPELTAVRNNRVMILDARYLAIPGPRVIDAIRDIATAIHGAPATPPTTAPH